MRVYIAGPITGNPNYMEQFAEAEKVLRQIFDDVYNPATELKTLAEWLDNDILLFVCTIIVANSDVIALLPGWQNSHGVRLELESALMHKLDVLEMRGINIWPIYYNRKTAMNMKYEELLDTYNKRGSFLPLFKDDDNASEAD